MAAAMNEPDGILEKLAANEYRINERYWVDVTHIINPHSFFVRPIALRSDLNYLQEMRDAVEVDEVREGKVVIYKSETLDSFVRGDIMRVVKIDGELKCDIKAIDYGCEDYTVPLWRLRKPRNDVAVPPLATHCLLSDCKSLEPGTWSPESIEAMKSFVGNERARMTVKGRTLDQLGVELVNSCPNDIATMLILTGYCAVGNAIDIPGSHVKQAPFEAHYFEYKTVRAGNILHVRCQSGSTLTGFFVAEVGDFHRYLRHRNDFSEYCMYQKTPKANELGIGRGVGYKSQFMMRYERSIVREVTCPTKVVIQQIDCGDIVEANINNLKIVKPTIFCQQPAIALYCSVTKEQEEVIDPSAFISKGVEFLITIKEVGENFYTPHIVEISELPSK